MYTACLPMRPRPPTRAGLPTAWFPASCKTGRFAHRNGPFQRPKQATPQRETGRHAARHANAAAAPGCAAASTGWLRAHTPIYAPPQPFAENMPPKHGPFTIIFLTFAKQKLQLKHILN